ncbi:MAG: hypothetical protein LBC81_04315 [Tannerellaceae bacterium]|jgi:natural product precursor|nr:hypothetical protein [Tannerellaceae bacterium]
MRKFDKLKLTQLSKEELNKREMNRVACVGSGECCICQHGGANHGANMTGGYSPSLNGTFTLIR